MQNIGAAKSLLIFQQGTLEDLTSTLRNCPAPTAVLTLRQITDDGTIVQRWLANNYPRCLLLDHGELENCKEILPYLDDYVRILAEWSQQKSSLRGENIREALAINGRVSAWWFFPFTEKFTSSEPVELFRAIYLLQRLPKAAMALPVTFVGSNSVSEAYLSMLRQLGFTQISWAQSRTERGIGPVGDPGHSPSFVSIIRALFLSVTGPLLRRPTGKTLFLSEYPASWRTGDSGTLDYYLDPLIQEATTTQSRDSLEIGLLLRSGPTLFNLKKLASALEFAVATSKRLGIKICVVDSHNSLWIRWRSSRWAKQVVKNVLPAILHGDFGRISYETVDLTPFFVSLMKKSLMNGEIARCLAMGNAVVRFLQRGSPELCVYRNEFYTSGRILSWATAESRVRSLSLQHGGLNPRHGVYLFHESETQEDLLNQDLVHRIPSPTFFGVWGAWFRDVLRRGNKYPIDGLPIVGSHRMEEFRQHALRINVEMAKNELNIPPGKPVLLYALQGLMHLDSIPLFIGALRQINFRGHVLFKPHPLLDVSNTLKQLINTQPVAFTYAIVNGDVAKMTAASDLIVSTCSSLGFETLYLGKPLVYIFNPYHDDYYPFTRFSPDALEARDVSAVADAITKLLGRKECRMYEDQVLISTTPKTNKDVLDRILLSTKKH